MEPIDLIIKLENAYEQNNRIKIIASLSNITQPLTRLVINKFLEILEDSNEGYNVKREILSTLNGRIEEILVQELLLTKLEQEFNEPISFFERLALSAEGSAEGIAIGFQSLTFLILRKMLKNQSTEEKAKSLLQSAITHPNKSFRLSTILLLKDFFTPMKEFSARLLLKALDDKQPQNRFEALLTLSESKAPEVIKRVAKMVYKDDIEDIRRFALNILFSQIRDLGFEKVLSLISEEVNKWDVSTSSRWHDCPNFTDEG